MRAIQPLLESAATAANVWILRTSYAPTGCDAHILSVQLRNLKHLDSVLLAEITKLQKQRLAVQAQARAHSALLAPVRRLPEELLSQIFLHAASNEGNIAYPGMEKSVHFTVVCRRWRDVAFRTAALWNRVDIKTYQPPSEATVANRLRLTGQTPLHISYFLGRSYLLEYAGDRYTNLLSILCEQSGRWETARLNGVPLAVTAWTPPPFPVLRELFIEQNRDYDEDTLALSRYLHLFHHAPNLRRVTIQCLTEPPFVAFPPSWSAITHLEIDCTGSDFVGECRFAPYIPALESCSHTIRSCKLRAHHMGDDLGRTHDIAFPVLEDLALASATIGLCARIVAPLLTSVRLSMSRIISTDTPSAELADFVALLEKSAGCKKLRRVSFSALNEEPCAVVSCLRRLPSSVEELDLSDGPYFNDEVPRALVTSEVMDALTRRAGVPAHNILPNLTHLRIRHDEDVEGLHDLHDDAAGLEAVIQKLRDSRTATSVREDGSVTAGFHSFIYDFVDLICEGKVTGKMPKIRGRQ
ncbi:hypothetical protein HDZ31DRAFT_38632 [Schizophyllum fasciatum]